MILVHYFGILITGTSLQIDRINDAASRIAYWCFSEEASDSD
jgi:hypothetical protein